MSRLMKKVLGALAFTVIAGAAHADETVNICSLMRPQPGKSEELRQSLLSLVEPTSKEEGALFYQVYGRDDGGIFLLEAWRTQKDLDRHVRHPAGPALNSKSGALPD